MCGQCRVGYTSLHFFNTLVQALPKAPGTSKELFQLKKKLRTLADKQEVADQIYTLQRDLAREAPSNLIQGKWYKRLSTVLRSRIAAGTSPSSNMKAVPIQTLMTLLALCSGGTRKLQKEIQFISPSLQIFSNCIILLPTAGSYSEVPTGGGIHTG